MKTKEEIEQLAKEEIERYRQSTSSIDKPKEIQRFNGYIKGYTQCQEDMADKKYTKEDVLKAGEIGEINHHDYKHIVSLLDEAKELNKQN